MVKLLISVFYKLIITYDRFYTVIIREPLRKSLLGYCGKNVKFRAKSPKASDLLSRIYMYDNTNIFEGFRFISTRGRLIIKNNSGIAAWCTVITGNHQRTVGENFKDSINPENDIERDVVIEEDVWVGSNCTILAGVTIGRGATVGAGSVCFKNIPPYAIVIGNPAKVVGFKFSPEEIIEHEKKLYKEEDRLPIDLIEKNYKKYVLDNMKNIKNYNGTICR